MLRKISLSLMVMCMLPQYAFSTISSGWEKHIIGEQTSPIYLYVEDIDGDGMLDVAASSDIHPWGSNSEVAWYRNNGTATDWEKTIISSDNADLDPIVGAAGIIISDIDGDGYKDAVVVTGNVITPKGDVYWFKSPADPTTDQWQRFTLETGVADSYFKVYTMDANGDENQDIVIGGNRGAALFLNPGNPDQAGAVWTKVLLPEETGSSIYLDDMNNDGKTDIVNSHTGFSATGYVGNVSWLDVADSGGEIIFNRTIIDPESIRAFDVNTMDVNGDGKKDVALSSFMAAGIYWYEQPANSGDAWIKHFVSSTYDGTDMYTGDIDGIGNIDLIVSGLFYNKISWFSYNWENGQAFWTEYSLDDNIAVPGDISLNDVDEDGDIDVVVAGMGDNQMLWYENKLNETLTTTTTVITTTTTTAPPTIIQLSSFDAVAGSGKIILEWTTESEIENAGFNLYRAESENGEYVKINDGLIPATGTPVKGSAYTFVDDEVENRQTYYYKLEDIEVSGAATMRGPVSATPRWIWGMFGN